MTTKEQVIESARRAGFITQGGIVRKLHSNGSWVSVNGELERFEQLVREAYRAKLLEGVGEPVAWRYEIEDGVYRYCRHKVGTNMQAEFGDLNPVALHTDDQLAAAVLAARNQALEEAAKECDEIGDSFGDADECAAEIRNLKETE